MRGVADPKQRLSDADRLDAVENELRLSAPAPVEIEPIGAAEILGDEAPVSVAKDPDMARGHVGVVENDVIVVATADADLRRIDAEAAGDLAMLGENLDPDHRATCSRSRKLLPSRNASS